MWLGQTRRAGQQNAPAGLHRNNGTSLRLLSIGLLVGAAAKVVALVDDDNSERQTSHASRRVFTCVSAFGEVRMFDCRVLTGGYNEPH